MKFPEILTWQEIDPEASKVLGAVGSHIICMEAWTGHARSRDGCLRKCSPEEEWDLKQDRYF